MSVIEIRAAREEDLEQVRDIYNHAVLSGTATLDWDPKSVEDFRNWLQDHEQHPHWSAHVAIRDSEVAGWATLSPFASRRGYRTNAELSVYVSPRMLGSGVGTALCASITQHAREAGLASVIALVTSTNASSIKMVERQGYRRCGEWTQIGFKSGGFVGLTLFEIVFEENCQRYLNGDMDDVFA